MCEVFLVKGDAGKGSRVELIQLASAVGCQRFSPVLLFNFAFRSDSVTKAGVMVVLWVTVIILLQLIIPTVEFLLLFVFVVCLLCDAHSGKWEGVASVHVR